MHGDTLSTVLRGLRLDGAVHFRCEFSAPWGFQTQGSPVAEFHFVISGATYVATSNATTLALQAGDLVVFPRGAPHSMRDAPSTPARPASDILIRPAGSVYGPVTAGGGGEPTSILCGWFRLDRSRPHPLIQNLPRLLHIRGGETPAEFGLLSTAHLLVEETAAMRQGTQAAVNRLVELLFIQALRAWLANSRPQTGVLAALADRHIGAALRGAHADIAHAWTLQSLASAASLSRAAFAARFQRLVGDSPMSYLTRLRIELADDLLMAGQLPVARAAERVGYRSEAAFARAFKRQMGYGPGAARRAGVPSAALAYSAQN